MATTRVDIGLIVTAINNATGVLRGIGRDVEGLGFAGQAAANRLKAIQVVLAGIALEKVRAFTKSVIDTTASFEAQQTQLAILTGDMQQAGRIIDQLNQKYDALGVSGDALTEVYVRLRQIGQTDDQTREVVDTIALMSAAGDRSADSVRKMGDILTKVLAKGTVDTKAFVSQFVQEFPDVSRIIARQLGARSVEELNDWAKAGEVGGRQFVEALKKGVKESYGGIFDITSNQVGAALNQLTSVFSDSIRKLSLDANLGPLIADNLRQLTARITDVVAKLDAEKVQKFFDALTTLGSVVYNLGAGFVSLAKLVGDAMDSIGTNIDQVARMFGGSADQMTGSVVSHLNSISAAGLGLLGGLMFGPLGFAVGAVIGATLDKVAAAFGFKADDMIRNTLSYLGGVGAASFGAIGLLFFGPLGGVAGVAIGTAIDMLVAKYFEAQGRIKSGTSGGGLLPSGEPFGVAAIQSADKYGRAVQNVARYMANLNKTYGDTAGVQTLIAERAKAAGLSIEQTAAIMAHARAESAFGKNLVGDNGHSFGLFQFNDRGELPKLQQFAEKAGKDWADFGVQVDFVIERFKQLGGASAQTATDASLVMNQFERFQGFSDRFGAETQKRIGLTQQYTNALRQQAAVAEIASKPRAETSGLGENFTSSQQLKFNQLATSIAGVGKQATQLLSTLNSPTPDRLAEETKARWEQVGTTMQQRIGELQKFRDEIAKTHPEQVGALAQIDELLNQTKNTYQLIGGEQDKAIDRQRQLGALMVNQNVLQQRLLQMKAQEAELQLLLQYSNNAIFNMFAGTSGGQLVLQTEQERIRLQQQQLEYENQIIQLKQRRLTTTDAAEREAIEKTIQQYQRLSVATQNALANLSAESVAQRQMWQSVGQTLESTAINGLTALITHTGTWRDVTRQAYNAITQAAVKYLIQLLEIKALMPLLNGMGIGSGFGGFLGGLFASGGVFPGHIRKFADGGVVSGPTFFGLMGEAGSEAIMPLANVGGKLGVRAVGGGGGDQYHVHINAIDTQTGTEFLLRNMQAIQAGLSHRRALNRGQRVGSASK